MKLIFRALASVLVLSLLSFRSARAQNRDVGVTKENLDLPFNATICMEDDGEETPEVVTFYGQTFEVDAIFYILGSSGSMQDDGELSVAKREVIENIQEFSDNVQFGVFFFDTGLLKYPSSGQPAQATPSTKLSAISWVNSAAGGGGTCGQPALAAALQMAVQAHGKHKAIVYVSEGDGTCPGHEEEAYLRETVAETTAQNWQRIQINTIGGVCVGRIQEKFLKDLAASNGGVYTQITR